ncbi:MAG TPA: MarR family transcriptional regulator [Candidatus Saccharimonadales bacterium]|nr:MarR family transcriptional regulator [Candidatus Saccharimonadales bacterium]
MTRKSLSAVGEEIYQTKPFATIEEELLVSLLRTTDVLNARFEQMIRPFNISMTQYNVLRILRGAGPDGRTCGEIGERMIAREPDVTRVLERMEKAGLIKRTRDTADRRVVVTRITSVGLKLLDEIDPKLREIDGLLKPMGERKLGSMLQLLDELREHVRQEEQ